MNIHSFYNIVFSFVSTAHLPYISRSMVTGTTKKLALLLSMVVCLGITPAFAGVAGDTVRTPFPDEFSDLDEGGSGATVSKLSPSVATRFENATNAYYSALAKLIKRDTAKAAKEFESAIALLNELYNEKEISSQPEFTKLVRNVIEDYELNITDISKLDDDASISILHRRMLEEVEHKPQVEAITGTRHIQAVKPATKTTIELPINEDVQKNLDFFTAAKGRPFMKKWLERSGRWFPMLKKIAREEGMPEEIVYLAMMESGLNPNAQSWAKAVGMWQFIESTGKMYDLEVNTWVDERKNVEKATRAAMHFLKDLYNDLGDWHLALAAYNCGPGGVRRAKRRSGQPDGNFWDIRGSLPGETKNYVPCYVATAMIAMNPAAYGFPPDSLTMMAPLAHDVYSIAETVNLAALAKCIEITEDSLKTLNPELRKSCTPPGTTYKLKIPAGSKDQMHKNYALLTPSEKQPWIFHTVERRETLTGIASRYGVPVSDIAAINNIKGYKSRLRRGTRIRIPVSGVPEQQETIDIAKTAAPTTTKSNTPQPPSSKTVAAKTSSTTPATTTKTVSHVVRSGENLTSIANQYHVGLNDLRAWNRLTPQDETILPGDTLVVGVTDRAVANARIERIATQKIVIHRVRRGETLAEIADKYNTSVSSLRSLNRLGKRNSLKYGTNLKVETTITSTRRLAQNTQQASATDVYKVRRGDTLSSISEKFGVSIADLRDLNPSLKKSDVVRIGQRLRVQ